MPEIRVAYELFEVADIYRPSVYQFIRSSVTELKVY